eukprot:GHUV01024274.1.p1 GENE.GHUV01024274.1~~GHUV01024274.1.p1  ORF type:complete len:167 (+),score=34.84 GHUV01024274.1:26-502(+)
MVTDALVVWPTDNLESLFAEELKRRGLDSLDGGESSRDEAGPSTSTSTSKSPLATKTTPRTKPAGADTSDQRQRSIALVNEGLEGLIPRASELLKLGSSVFLAFAPFIVAISLLFGGIYMVFGESFVHGGDRHSGLPAYVDPQTLLSEPTVDPYVPFQ